MSALEVAKAAQLSQRRDGTGDDAFEAAAGLHFEGVDQSVSGFADGNHEHATVGIQVEEIFSDAEDSTLALDVTLEGAVDAGFGEGAFKKMAGGNPHVEGEAFTIRRHRGGL